MGGFRERVWRRIEVRISESNGGTIGGPSAVRWEEAESNKLDTRRGVEKIGSSLVRLLHNLGQPSAGMQQAHNRNLYMILICQQCLQAYLEHLLDTQLDSHRQFSQWSRHIMVAARMKVFQFVSVGKRTGK